MCACVCVRVRVCVCVFACGVVVVDTGTGARDQSGSDVGGGGSQCGSAHLHPVCLEHRQRAVAAAQLPPDVLGGRADHTAHHPGVAKTTGQRGDHHRRHADGVQGKNAGVKRARHDGEGGCGGGCQAASVHSRRRAKRSATRRG